VTEDGAARLGPAWLDLMEEVGISPLWRGFHFVLWAASMLLAAIAVVTAVVGIFVGVSMLEITFALITAAVVSVLATNWWRRYLVRKVRWVEGTVTFRAVEAGRNNRRWPVRRVSSHDPSTVEHHADSDTDWTYGRRTTRPRWDDALPHRPPRNFHIPACFSLCAARRAAPVRTHVEVSQGVAERAN
jgi:hypothetical protein